MRTMKSCLYLFCLMLMGCQGLPPVAHLPPQPQQIQLFKVEQVDQDNQMKQTSLLTLQIEPEQWRWIMSDPLGTPLARLRLSTAGWQNDGFAPPNTQAKWLFSALATALNPHNPPFVLPNMQFQGTSQQFQIEQKATWKIKAQPPKYQLFLADQSIWHIEKLN
ncbi:hypothetical protein [Volucribacter amazonae]|nr:hypothetical protein [Volucribacter amazonae]